MAISSEISSSSSMTRTFPFSTSSPLRLQCCLPFYCFRQSKFKNRSVTQFAFDFDFTLMQFHKFFGDRKPQARSFFPGPAFPPKLLKFIENFFQVLAGNSSSRVAHDAKSLFVFFTGNHIDRTAFR